MASRAWRRLSQTKTPLPAARPSALRTRPRGRPKHEVAGLGGGAEDAFLAALLDLDLHARAEHLARVHDPVDRLERLGGGPAVQRVADGRAAARADDQGDLAREDVVLGVGCRAEDAVIGRRDPGLPHQVLGEDLAPLELGGFLARAEDPQALALKDVDDPLDQRLLRADDRQPDPFSLGELDQAPEVAGLDRHVLHVERRARVARAQKTAVTRGDCLSFQQRACSRPPLPMTRTFNALAPILKMIHGACRVNYSINGAAVGQLTIPRDGCRVRLTWISRRSPRIVGMTTRRPPATVERPMPRARRTFRAASQSDAVCLLEHRGIRS